MIAMSRHDRRVLIVGFSAILLLLGASKFGPKSVNLYRGSLTSAVSLQATVSRDEASIRALPITRDSLVARSVRMASLDSAIVDGKTPALAGATLSELISDYSEESRTQLGNLQVRNDSAAESAAFVIVGLHASVRGDLAAITRFLARIESGPTLLAVRELDISSEGDASNAQSSTESLRAELTVEGLARSPSRGGTAR